MSETYHLCCATCKEHIWIGQGHPTTLYIYSGDPEVMAYLNEFLRKHLSSSTESLEYKPNAYHELLLLDSQSIPEDEGWMEDYRPRNVVTPKVRWYFRGSNGAEQELEEYKGTCITDFHYLKNESMLEAVKDMTENSWRLVAIVQDGS